MLIIIVLFTKSGVEGFNHTIYMDGGTSIMLFWLPRYLFGLLSQGELYKCKKRKKKGKRKKINCEGGWDWETLRKMKIIKVVSRSLVWVGETEEEEKEGARPLGVNRLNLLIEATWRSRLPMKSCLGVFVSFNFQSGSVFMDKNTFFACFRQWNHCLLVVPKLVFNSKTPIYAPTWLNLP